MKYKKIFIACPISKYLKKNSLDKDFEIFIKDIYNFCKQYNDNIFLALEREKYGQNRMYGSTCTLDDFQKMKESDLVIAFPEDSMGVAVELGWASMAKKEILLFVDKNYKQSELVKAINSITKGKTIEIDTNNGYLWQIDNIKEKIKEYIN